MVQRKIVVLDGYTLNPGDLSWEELALLGDLTVYERTNPHQSLERAQDADIILTNKTRIDAKLIAQLNRLRYIGVLATGYNVVDIARAIQQNVIVTNVPTYGTNAVAQMAMAHLLSLCHRVEHHSQLVKDGYWSNAMDWCFWDSPQIELTDKIIGIIGLGRIGYQIARIAFAMGMRVQAYSPRPYSVQDIPHFQWVALEKLLQTSDVVSLNCPVTPETENLINKTTLEMMQPSALLLNVSRGGLIVEQDLANALNNGNIGGAGLDVLAVEPPHAENQIGRAHV